MQTLGRYMARMTPKGPAFEIDPKCRIMIDAFEAGYVWEEITRTGSLYPSTRRPKKDGFYDHLMNTAEYTVLNFAGISVKDQKALRRQSSIDRDPADAPPSRAGVSRAGY